MDRVSGEGRRWRRSVIVVLAGVALAGGVTVVAIEVRGGDEEHTAFCAASAHIWPGTNVDPYGRVAVINAATEQSIEANEHCHDQTAPALGPSCSIWGTAANDATGRRPRLARLDPATCARALADARDQ
jgi:hypothetical protein